MTSRTAPNPPPDEHRIVYETAITTSTREAVCACGHHFTTGAWTTVGAAFAIHLRAVAAARKVTLR